MNGLLQLSSPVVDLVYRIPALPAPGGEALATSVQVITGGGFNAMRAARRAGMAVACGGPQGTGPFADMVQAAMAAEGIRVLLPPGPEDQGTCVVLVEDGGERSFVCKDGGQGVLTAADLALLPVTGWDAILLTGYTLVPEGNRALLADWVAELPPGAPLVFDPSPIIGTIPQPLRTRILSRTAWLTCNRAEAEALTGEADPLAALNALLTRACPEARGAVIRLGSEGCIVAEPGRAPIHVPGFAVEAVDTTGAGDCHVGVFLAALAAGEDPVAAARRANAAAALSVTRAGPATAPTAAETQGLLCRAPGGTLPESSDDRG